MKKIKIIQILIVIFLVISAYFFGKLSMMDRFNSLNERISQLEIQINQLEAESPEESHVNIE